MKRHRLIHRLVPATAAMALLITACGSDDPSAEPVDSVDEDGGLRAPTPIEAVGTGSASSGDDAARASAEMATTDMMIAPAYVVTDFVVGPDLPALPENTTGYVYDAATSPTSQQVAELADVLGVEGEPVEVDDGYSVSWRVGPDDGSASTVVVWDDAMLSWNYNTAWQDHALVRCVSAGSAGVEPAVERVDAPGEPYETVDRIAPIETVVPEPVPEPMECETPPPPSGVPTAAEAEALASGYLTDLGVDPAALELDTHADEWSASVTANLLLDGVVAQSWGFTFGGEAELQYAWGNAATPEAVGPYTLVDLDTAVARLQDGSYGWGGWRGDVALMSEATGVAEVSDVAVAPAAGGGTSSDEPGVEEPPVDLPEGDVAPAEPELVPAPEPMPVEPMPVEPMPAPEEITVTLVDVEPDLWWIWDVHGSAWLVPAYRFTGDDGRVYTVPAVTDDFLVQTAPPVTTEVPETVPPVDPGTGGPLERYLGLPLAEFEAAVAAEGLGPVRIVEVDGEPQMVTMDLQEGRVNVAVETRDGVQYVTSATVESINGGVDVVPPTTAPTVPVVGVFEDVAFYPACGNEILDHDGVVWYTLSNFEYPSTEPEYAERFKELSSVDREPSPVAGVNGFAARVAPPGPGDDVGTLVVWADGVARFVSDSGDLDVWLVDDELTYNWVC